MTVLVPHDGSDLADAALDHALDQFDDETVRVLTVIDPADAETLGAAPPPGVPYESPVGLPGAGEEWYERAEERAEEICEDARERAADADVPVETTIETGRPSRVIVDAAEEEDVEQVVMGSHGRSGVTRILLGSVAETVMRRAPCPVTVVR